MTQSETESVEELADLKFCVGFHWFRYRDHPGNNQGLLKANDNPWEELVNTFKQVNPMLDARHSR